MNNIEQFVFIVKIYLYQTSVTAMLPQNILFCFTRIVIEPNEIGFKINAFGFQSSPCRRLYGFHLFNHTLIKVLGQITPADSLFYMIDTKSFSGASVFCS
ncbi:MAG: hypothetical protein II076_01100, partial [Bacteroidales bacterium]|nr:hypothetical protein [Bacteroidales bacterium]